MKQKCVKSGCQKSYLNILDFGLEFVKEKINRTLTFKLTLKRIEGVKNVKRRADLYVWEPRDFSNKQRVGILVFIVVCSSLQGG